MSRFGDEKKLTAAENLLSEPSVAREVLASCPQTSERRASDSHGIRPVIDDLEFKLSDVDGVTCA